MYMFGWLGRHADGIDPYLGPKVEKVTKDGPLQRQRGKAVSDSNTGGIGLCGLLTILFIALKLTGYIDWSWWWVWSPI